MALNAAAGADTFPKLLVRNAQAFGARPAMRHKDLGIWQTWTWAEVLDIVRAYAVGLHRLGLKRGETIAIVGANRPRLYWSVMAAQMLGAIPFPVYADAVAEELAYVLAHADVRFAAVEDQEQVDKIQSVSERVPKLELMLYDEKRGLRDYDHSRLHSMEDVVEEGREQPVQLLDAVAKPETRLAPAFEAPQDRTRLRPEARLERKQVLFPRVRQRDASTADLTIRNCQVV